MTRSRFLRAEPKHSPSAARGATRPMREGALRPFDAATQDLVGGAARLLAARGVDAYLVGGAIRDGLLGKTADDADIALDGSPHGLAGEMADALGARAVLLDADRDAVRIVAGDEARRASIDLTRMIGGSIDADLRRRDFTIDAIAVDLQDAASGRWRFVDPLGALADLDARVIRVASDSAVSDDPLRALRAARIAAETGFRIELATCAAIRRDVRLLRGVSPERVREELLAALAAPRAGESVALMDSLGILSAVIPELDAARGVTQPKEHCYDVFGHLTAAVGFAASIVEDDYEVSFVSDMMPRFEGMSAYFARPASDGHARGTLLKFTALLHDVAKPQTKTVEPSGRMRFFGHSELGEEIALGVMRRLRFGKRAQRLVGAMIRHHLRPRQMASAGELPTNRAIHRYYRDLADAALDTLYLNMADFLAARGPLLTPAEMSVQTRVIRHILRVGPQPPTQAPNRGLLTGHDIMRELGLQPGPMVGRLLKAVAAAEADGRIGSRGDALQLAKTCLKSGGRSG